MTPPQLHSDRILTLLNDELGLHATGLIMLKPGAWSAAYAFTANERDWVVRFSEHRGDFACDAYAARFSGPDLPIPRVTHLGEWDGAHVAISECVPGGFIDDLTPGGLRDTLPSLIRMLDALRRADVSGSTGYGGWDLGGNGTHERWAGFLWDSLQDSPEYRGGSWRPALEQSSTGASAFDRDIRVLERRLRDLPDVRHLIHSDLLNFNLLVQDDAVTGVIDWGCALYGDFFYELAWFAFWWPWYSQWSRVDVVGAALEHYARAGADLHDAELRIRVYMLHIGLGHQAYNASIGNWVELENVARMTTSVADELR